MSFSFIDIEQKKSKAIWGIFLFIICVYFLTIYFLLVVAENIVYLKLISSQYAMSRQLSWPVFPPFEHVLAVFLLAFVAAILHWAFSTDNLIFKLSFAAGAEKIDPKDIYHQHFKNIVDEVSIALGGRNIEPMIVCSASANAFALADFEGRAVIGVTEGLLARLNRAQIEAVVGHEAAHIASGDCLTTTITCSLGELYDEGIKRLSQTLENSQGRAGVYILLAWIVIAFTGFLSRLLRCFLSRERELRADAIAVRLTRDPLSLAEALKLISRNWRGAGTQGENLQSIFIVNPRAEAIDESEGFFSDMFSTHPPIKARVAVLLEMAHLDEASLEEKLKGFIRVSPVAVPVSPIQENAGTKRWNIFNEGQWSGLYSLDELRSAMTLLPAQWVRPEGGVSVVQASDDPDLKILFGQGAVKIPELSCPNCKVGLSEYIYEGSVVLRCAYCGGAFVDSDRVSRILIRQDYQPSKEVERLAKIAAEAKDRGRLYMRKLEHDKEWVIDCPKCKRKMHRQFFVYSYPVEIDRCPNCFGTWFDKFELEILQYVYEHYEDILYNDKSF